MFRPPGLRLKVTLALGRITKGFSSDGPRSSPTWLAPDVAQCVCVPAPCASVGTCRVVLVANVLWSVKVGFAKCELEGRMLPQELRRPSLEARLGFVD